MQNVGTVEKGKQRLAGLKLEQLELDRKVAAALAEQHRRWGRLCEQAGLFEASGDDEMLLKGLRDLAARFRNTGASAISAGDTIADATTGTAARSKGKSRDVPVPAEG
jgi:hypothetical protein